MTSGFCLRKYTDSQASFGKSDIGGFEEVLSIFPCPELSQGQSTWYLHWLAKQIVLLPPGIVQLLESNSKTSSGAPLLSEQSRFIQIFVATSHYAQANPNCSIDDIVNHLSTGTKRLNFCQTVPADMLEDLVNARNLVFAIIGWQTMLYTPAFGVTPPDQFAIEDTLDGYNQGHAFISLKQPHNTAKYNSKTFLKGFGLLMAAPNLCFCEEQPERVAFETTSVLSPRELNIALLQQFSGIKIKWIDNIAPHMELDTATGTLFLFRFPSFCLINIPPITTQAQNQADSVLQSLADFTSTETNWMKAADTTAFLKEILLSYRFLFGQEKASRKTFRNRARRDVLDNGAYETMDPLLDPLCGRKIFNSPIVTERETYRLHRDFPFLRGRIVTLKRELALRKPRSWGDLWRDKRDTSNWYTFWAVIFIGGAGVILGVIQTAIAIAQFANSS
ncbi:hypothetical protein BDD12DRAFT_913749 [Trichophaea hybrida]|nr:hypothetical protein BDD12DRAFT_914012 [Trichophaea hybrida]KAF8533970.1 hypothetical protein BDD12DRAFT_913749 [Trichophaea hybrida]